MSSCPLGIQSPIQFRHQSGALTTELLWVLDSIYSVRTYILCGAKFLWEFNFADGRFFGKIEKYWLFLLVMNFCDFQKVDLVSLMLLNSFSSPWPHSLVRTAALFNYGKISSYCTCPSQRQETRQNQDPNCKSVHCLLPVSPYKRTWDSPCDILRDSNSFL